MYNMKGLNHFCIVASPQPACQLIRVSSHVSPLNHIKPLDNGPKLSMAPNAILLLVHVVFGGEVINSFLNQVMAVDVGIDAILSPPNSMHLFVILTTSNPETQFV